MLVHIFSEGEVIKNDIPVFDDTYAVGDNSCRCDDKRT